MIPATGERAAQGVVEIVGPDLERSLAFYLALGFELERRTGPFAVVHWQGVRIFLAEDRAAVAGERWASLRIMVSDVDAMWEEVSRLALPVECEIGDRFYGLRDFTIVDPSGFGIRFAQAI